MSCSDQLLQVTQLCYLPHVGMVMLFGLCWPSINSFASHMMSIFDRLLAIFSQTYFKNNGFSLVYIYILVPSGQFHYLDLDG